MVLILDDKKEKIVRFRVINQSRAREGLSDNTSEVHRLKVRWRLPETEMSEAKNYTHEDTKAKPKGRSHRHQHCSEIPLPALSVFLATEQQENAARFLLP